MIQLLFVFFALLSINDKSLYNNEVAPGYYLDVVPCDDFTYICCCANDQKVCSGPGNMIICIPGGAFDCSSDLGDCTENPSHDCDGCCNPRGA